MKRPITNITFRGYYEVARASDYLTMRGIANEIVRTPIKKTGCGNFTLAVEYEEEKRVIEMLMNSQKR